MLERMKESMDDRLKLVFPTLAYRAKAEAYIREFFEYGSEINGTGGLDRYLRQYTYEDWLQKVIADMDIANLPDGKVPALTYFYVREADDAVVGMINIRLALNDLLRTECGHIGYGIRPTERRKHYATRMLQDALKVCDVIGIQKVIVTCDTDNVASARVIRNCGGVLDTELYSETFQSEIQRYLIKR